MLRLIVLGALGYLGYKYLGSTRAAMPGARETAVAGGPLSEHAALQADPDQPPLDNPFGAATRAASPA
jgi:hypothetical protein